MQHRGPGLIALLLATILPGAASYPALTASPVDVATADNTFGFRLLNAVQKANPHGNVVLSPVSAALKRRDINESDNRSSIVFTSKRGWSRSMEARTLSIEGVSKVGSPDVRIRRLERTRIGSGS